MLWSLVVQSPASIPWLLQALPAHEVSPLTGTTTLRERHDHLIGNEPGLSLEKERVSLYSRYDRRSSSNGAEVHIVCRSWSTPKLAAPQSTPKS